MVIHIGIWRAFIIGHKVRNEAFFEGDIDCIAFFVAVKNEWKLFFVIIFQILRTMFHNSRANRIT